MYKLLDSLGMKTIDEGCSIEQIAICCNRYKITYYVLDFKYKLFETNCDKSNNRSLQTLVFMCANNHMYPVLNEGNRQTIFKKYASTIGQGMVNNKHKKG